MSKKTEPQLTKPAEQKADVNIKPKMSRAMTIAQNVNQTLANAKGNRDELAGAFDLKSGELIKVEVTA
ncbi:hypothetical protein PNIG_a2046 [Pseudoalteromonas nigrifaciens]|uniref:Orphan protein n=2 Tax=Pseudoalteromonas TaxID=53246 RepID=Q3IGL4_PSET1|nr:MULTISPECIES: hypothetical protein [Pseudoalteromonas]ASM54108.1 hypothetical protein PNIG_a2046 [Pseudoalteromonas nigrifaciens]GEN42578.1 hypothetical protein PNI02_20440 [Pseudoalteromonas nigrifaciens]CAI86619.1 putative orphan protein [Pseudoalteromonas translucida]SUC52061.1 Uncharacterised protein [Pseudoalteromonas nigrifaciens]